MQQRLQKCISEAGVASRRTAEAMISAMSNPAWDKRSSRNSPLRICGNCTASFWNRGELPLAPAKTPASLPPPSAVSTPPSTKPSKRQQTRG